MGKLFMVMALKTEHEAVLEIGPDKKVTVPIKMEWADGMVGALPIFNNIEDAAAYAGKKHAVMELAEIGVSIDKRSTNGGD